MTIVNYLSFKDIDKDEAMAILHTYMGYMLLRVEQVHMS